MSDMNSSKIIKAMLMSALLLGFFGAVGTAMVGAVYELTEEQIALNTKLKLLESLNTVIAKGSYDNDLLEDTVEVKENELLANKGNTTVYQAKKEGKVIAVAFNVTATEGYSGDINILIGILSNSEISAVRVIDHKETPGLGDKIEVERSDWIKSFNHTSLIKPIESLWKVKKDGGVFDQFTGATITPRAVVKGIHKALQYFKQNKNVLLAQHEMQDKKTEVEEQGEKIEKIKSNDKVEK